MKAQETTKHQRLADGDTFENVGEPEGYYFRVTFERDDYMGEPWKEHDGHGIVSDWTRRDKLPGERVLCEDRDSKRYYDVQGTLAIAKKDGWGCDSAKLTTKLGRKPSAKEVIAEAVEQDYQYLRGWCNDEWCWMYAMVRLFKEDDTAEGGSFETKYFASLGGIQSDDCDYLTDVAYELAEEILSDLNAEN